MFQTRGSDCCSCRTLFLFLWVLATNVSWYLPQTCALVTPNIKTSRKDNTHKRTSISSTTARLETGSTNNNNNNGEKPEEPFRLVTWNILAPSFCHPQKYYWTPEEQLMWPGRKDNIISEIERMNADIICLQEVEAVLFDEFMEPFRGEYEGILQNVTNDHPVTNAVLIRKKKFRVLRQESRSRALILVLDRLQAQTQAQANTKSKSDRSQQHSTTTSSTRASSNRPLYLAAVHLQAGMEDDETRVCQLKSLLKRMNNHVRIEIPDTSKGKKNKEEKSDNCVPPPIILAGDFNMLPTNPVHRWLSHQQHRDDDTTKPKQQPTVNLLDTGTGLELVDLTFPKDVRLLPLKDTFFDLPPTLVPLLVGATTNPNQQLAVQKEDLNVKQQQQRQQPIQMTYCGGSVLDYIWTSSVDTNKGDQLPPPIQVHQTMVFHPAAFSQERQFWPSQDHPSDHLPIGIDFSWS